MCIASLLSLSWLLTGENLIKHNIYNKTIMPVTGTLSFPLNQTTKQYRPIQE